MRAIILATHLPADASLSEFWEQFAADERPLRGCTVLDPFMGGGTTVVEAARLGADVIGSDVDPLAVEICRYELDPAPGRALTHAGNLLVRYLNEHYGHLYPGEDGDPLHYFSVAIVGCPECDTQSPLYRNLILVRDRGRSGAVVRDHGLTVFCPTDFTIHRLADADRVRLHHCGKYHRLEDGTFAGGLFTCPTCGARSSHRDLQTGAAPRKMLAVEVIPERGRRYLRAVTDEDLEAIEHAEGMWRSRRSETPWLNAPIQTDRFDDRPVSYGIETTEGLYWPRQLLVLTAAFEWVDQANISDAVRGGLRLALSNALLTNNRLCGYATDYGRLAGLFSVRGYSLPTLSVELNPIQRAGGRGTISAAIRRVAKAADTSTTRYAWSDTERKPYRKTANRPTGIGESQLYCTVAEELTKSVSSGVDYCIFDPPYYDYIHYSELSEFHRTWFPDMQQVRDSLVPREPGGVELFGQRLGNSLVEMTKLMRAGTPIVFTYHSVNPKAWEGLGIALDLAGLAVTALWPVRSDGHMGHHSHEGNCEWDLIFVCRPRSSVVSAGSPPSSAELIELVTPLKVSESDRASITMACELVQKLYFHPDDKGQHGQDG